MPLPRTRILPYKQGSRSARALSNALDAMVLRTRNSRFTARPNDMIINWGSQVIDARHARGIVINDPRRVGNASNKLRFFREITAAGEAEIIPTYWTRRDEVPEDQYPIVCRTILNGHSGAGIVIANTPEELVDAPLYVKYIKKQEEFRVHVGDSGEKVIAIQRKARQRSVPDEEVNWHIRNHSNGFIFMRNGISTPDTVIDVAKRALAAIGLDFGAVDVIYNRNSEKAYVLEINTAPGLEGQTVNDYVNYFTGQEADDADDDMDDD